MQRTKIDLESCMLVDRVRLQRKLKRGAAADSLNGEIERSQILKQKREQRLVVPDFDQSLPINQKREEIERAILNNQVVVVCGETGSGKSTQLPKICLKLGRGVDGYVGHTQPRRIAAHSIAQRIADELRSELGESVGFKIRFGGKLKDTTHIKVMTDGILLSEIEHDRFLNQYDTLIIDEAHERSLNIDFLLGYCRWLLPRRPDLRLVITSATIDPKQFSRYFNNAPVIEVSGRMYPVQIRYRPFDESDVERSGRNMMAAVLKAVDELWANRSGVGDEDILVFLPGEREIHELLDLLKKRHLKHAEILPLYARLPNIRQQQIFQPHRGTRIILSTNVAETSLTVPGVRYVIDTGLARVSRYRPTRQVQALPIENISRASADQRKGRCGRVASGTCIRIYSEADFMARPEFSEPEIQRTSLAAVILKMLHMGLGRVDDFPFIDPPAPRMIKDGYRLLEELGAVDAQHRLTKIGRQLAKLPVDPRIGRMLLASDHLHCLNEVLIIGAALAVQDPREQGKELRQRARELHAEYRSSGNDFLSYLALWAEYDRDTKHLSQRQTRNYCAEHLLSFNRMREWRDVWRQLNELTKRLHLKKNTKPAAMEALHQALLSGLLGNIGCKQERGEYIGARGKKFYIHPGSGAFKHRPKWIVCAELVDTTKLYARTVGQIQPQWIGPLARHLTRKSYFEPHWLPKREQVMAYEQVSLYGLVVVPRRKIHYGPVEPQQAREIFIRAALVEGRINHPAPFLIHNLQLVSDIEDMESKSRKRDILAGEDTLFSFYDSRVPQDIYTNKQFEHWRQAMEASQPKLLYMEPELLMRRGAGEITIHRFPTHFEIERNRLPLRYRFEPGNINDGVTVLVPLGLHKHLPRAPFTWLVPGLLLEKIIALIKSLPKPLRRNLVPAPDYAERCLHEIDPTDGSLIEALAKAIHRITGIEISPNDWDESRLPAHLMMNFEIVDDKQEVVAHGRNLAVLCSTLVGMTSASEPYSMHNEIERTGISKWDFGDIPATIQLSRNGFSLTGYPRLVDTGDTLEIRVMEGAASSNKAHRAGLRKLLLKQLPQHARQLRKNTPEMERMCLNFYNVGSCDTLRRDLIDASLDQILASSGDPNILTRHAFDNCVEQGRENLISHMNTLRGLVGPILELYRQCSSEVDTCGTEAKNDLEQQLGLLIYPGFVGNTPITWLQHFPRYLRAVSLRIKRLQQSPAKDKERMSALKPHWERYIATLNTKSETNIDEYRWSLEEYRVSLFAQELRTKHPVSARRLERLWGQIRDSQDNRIKN